MALVQGHMCFLLPLRAGKEFPLKKQLGRIWSLSNLNKEDLGNVGKRTVRPVLWAKFPKSTLMLIIFSMRNKCQNAFRSTFQEDRW